MPLDKIRLLTQHIRTPGYVKSDDDIVTASPGASVSSRPPGRDWADSIRAAGDVGESTEDLNNFTDTDSSWRLNNDKDQPYIVGDSFDNIASGGLYQGHFDDMYNKADEIIGRNDNVEVGDKYGRSGSRAIYANYNQDWSRYPSDTDTTKYDKYNYSTKTFEPNLNTT